MRADNQGKIKKINVFSEAKRVIALLDEELKRGTVSSSYNGFTEVRVGKYPEHEPDTSKNGGDTMGASSAVAEIIELALDRLGILGTPRNGLEWLDSAGGYRVRYFGNKRPVLDVKKIRAEIDKLEKEAGAWDKSPDGKYTRTAEADRYVNAKRSPGFVGVGVVEPIMRGEIGWNQYNKESPSFNNWKESEGSREGSRENYRFGYKLSDKATSILGQYGVNVDGHGAEKFLTYIGPLALSGDEKNGYYAQVSRVPGKIFKQVERSLRTIAESAGADGSGIKILDDDGTNHAIYLPAGLLQNGSFQRAVRKDVALPNSPLKKALDRLAGEQKAESFSR